MLRLLAILAAIVFSAPPAASAQMLLRGVGPAASGGCVGMCVTYLGRFVDTANRTDAYTWTAANLGPASADRIIVAGVVSGATSAATYGTVTAGGVNLTRANADPAGGTTFNAFWYGAVPAGDNGDVVVPVTSGTLARVSIDLWAITGSVNTAPAAVSDDPSDAANTPTIQTNGFDVTADGVSLVIARSNLTAVPPSLTCTQTTCNVRANAQTGGESQWVAAGDATGAGTGRTWTLDTNGGGTGQLAITAIVWEP